MGYERAIKFWTSVAFVALIIYVVTMAFITAPK